MGNKSLKMKLAVLTAALTMSTSVAMAAAPAKPVFGTTAGYTKVADGYSGFEVKGQMAISGSTILRAVTPIADSDPDGGNEIFSSKKIARSSDGGLTWQGVYRIATTTPGMMGEGLQVGISGTTTKIVHAVWAQHDGIGWGLYYSWADNANLNIWSSPVKITGSIEPAWWDDSFSLSVGKNGDIQVLFGGYFVGGFYYTKATSNTSVFTDPVPMAEQVDGMDTVLDSAGNLHLIYGFGDSNGRGWKYTKLPAGSSTWTDPKTIIAPVATGSVYSARIAAYDANNLYVASGVNADSNTSGIQLFTSTNGGSTWTKSTISTATGDRWVSSIAVSSSKVLAIAYNLSNNGGATNSFNIIKSTDGKTWSAPAVNPVPNLTSATIVFDSNNKMNIGCHTRGPSQGQGDERATYFLKEK